MAKKARKKGRNALAFTIIAIVVGILLGGTGVGLYFIGLPDSLLGIESEDAAKDEPVELGKPVYHELPEFIADLKTGKCRAPFIKLSLTIQVDEKDLPIVLEREPKIIDRFQQHLRSKERQELSGKKGAEILRAELTLLLATTIKLAKVQNVLFRSLIVQ